MDAGVPVGSVGTGWMAKRMAVWRLTVGGNVGFRSALCAMFDECGLRMAAAWFECRGVSGCCCGCRVEAPKVNPYTWADSVVAVCDLAVHKRWICGTCNVNYAEAVQFGTRRACRCPEYRGGMSLIPWGHVAPVERAHCNAVSCNVSSLQASN